MQTNWECIEGKWYYFEESGVMLTDGSAPDGYKVGADGVSLEKAEAMKRWKNTLM